MIQNILDFIGSQAISSLLFLGVFCILFVIRFLYLLLFTGRVLFRKKTNISETEGVPLSLILTVRNQEENLKNNIPKVLSEEGVELEMVVVDDYSQDNTYLVLGLLKGRYKKLKISVLNEETRYSEKLAQNVALKAAGNQWVLHIPVSITGYECNWLKNISRLAEGENNLIVSYSGIEKSKGLFNLLYRIENYFQFIKSTGYILNGIPFVYSEENIAFCKNKYFEIGGFGSRIKEPYANLELIINSFIKKRTTVLPFNRATAIYKSEKISASEYSTLLKKSFRIEKQLSFFKRSILVLDEITRLLFLPYLILVIVLFIELWPILLLLLGLKLLIYLFIIKITQKRLNERKIFISSLVYELIMPYFKLFYRWRFNQQSKTKGWRSKV